MRIPSPSLRRRAAAAVAATIMVTGGLIAVAMPITSASADTIPRGAGTVTADALPTAQINGVAWSQAISNGNTVWVGGSFSNARPAGSAAGVNTVTRTNLMSYALSTGVMTSWAPAANAQVRAVAVSPDGKRVYVGGDFTKIDASNRYRIAAFDTTTGALITTFAPIIDYKVTAIVATNTTVYVGGSFATAAGSPRNRAAAFAASSGALTTWDPNLDASVTAMVMSPDGTHLILGGTFQNANNGLPAYGLASVDAVTGTLLPWAAGNQVRNAGSQAGITSLSTDGTSIIGTGYVFGSGGNLEGTFSADPNSGTINWIEDCHGDTYSAYANSAAVYTVSHAHYCGNIGGFPQSTVWSVNSRHALAFTKNATGTITPDPYGYYNWAGNPSPSLMNWFPDMTTGTASGQSQAAWSITGSGAYVVLAGEFPTVNGSGQQGLVRFATTPTAPGTQGPRLTGSNFVPSVVSLTTGTARVAFQANWDRDDTTLTYKVIRNSDTAHPVYTRTVDSEYWNRPSMGFTDTGLTPGATYKYRLQASDPNGNTVLGDNVTVTVANSGSASQYVKDVTGDGASHLWRLDQATSATTSYDWAGYEDLTLNVGVTGGTDGAINGDSDTSSAFDGNTGLAVDPNQVTGPNVFSEEAWFKTTSTSGGKIVGFGNASSGTSSSYDRHIYMTGDGSVWFGVYNGNTYTVNTPTAYNDGQWHHAVGTMDASGPTLYVDGKKIGHNSGTSVAQAYSGYWRIGGDSTWSGNQYFSGQIDDVAIYPTSLTRAQVQTHYVDSGRSLPGATAPADSYGKAVYADTPDAYYRMDETSGPSATDRSGNGSTGTYSGGESFGTSSPVSGATGTAVSFNGSDGTLASAGPIAGPSVYSEELWFNTTTGSGGKLIGFGDQPSGYSGNYDRHVYMENSGQLTFGVWTGFTNTITSPASYNDGQWHYMVASQGPDGMKLYVDNQLVGTNGQTGQQGYNGYWRVGGDSDWGGSSAFFNGAIDEVAVYSSVLTPTQIGAHYNASSAINHAPTAAFSATTSNLTVAVDGTGSSDSDGTVASYAWDFGDGATASTATASHTYAQAGNYTVTLRVTDNGGAFGTTTKTVTVTAPNIPPTASWTASTSDLSASFDGTASNDPDGTIASFAWSFGDGQSGTGSTTSHTYAAAGTYSVSLTVTDDRGASNTKTGSVTVTPANVPPVASFTATASKFTGSFDASASTDSDGSISSYSWDFGDGSTGSGQTISHVYGAAGTYTAKLTVTDNSGASTSTTKSVTITGNALPTAAFSSSTSSLTASFDASASSDSDGTIASYAWSFGDGGTGSGKLASHTYGAAGNYSVTLTVTDDDNGTNSITKSVTVTAPNSPPKAAFAVANTGLSVNVDGSTSSDTDGTISSYAWSFGDSGTATGKTASHTYAAAGTYTVTLTVTDNAGATDSASQSVTVTAPANVPPKAAFTTSVTGLKVSADGSGSTDADGTITGYAWNFGDGGTATGASATHSYGAAGNYTVTLTVTDNAGATDTASSTVTVTAATVYASDNFSRTTANSFGSAVVGGAWSLGGASNLFSTDGSVGKVKVTAAGAGPTAFLNGVSAQDVDARVDVAVDSAPTGGGTYLTLAARRAGTSDYGVKVRILPTSTTITLLKVVNGTETSLKAVTVSGLLYNAGDVLRIRFQVSGSGTSTLSGKVWKVGAAEPTTWQVSTTDSTAGVLQSAGAVGIQAYLSGSSTTVPVIASFDNLSVTSITN